MASGRDDADAPVSAGAREVLDASNDAVAVVSGAGVVVGWTRGAEALLGYRGAEVVGRSAAPLLAMPGDPARVAGVAERCRAGVGWNGLIPLRHRDGSRIEVDLRVSASFPVGADECFLISAREQRPRWTVGQSVLDGLLTRSPVGMAVMDPELRYLWLNDTLESLGGVPRDQRLGRRLSEVLPGIQADTIEALMRRVLTTGAPITDHEYAGWSWSDPHRQHAYSASFFPLVDVGNSVTGVCYLVLNVTERWNARRLLSLINEAGTSIGRTLDVLATAQELADFAVPRFADFVVVDLLEPVLSAEGQGTWLCDAGPARAKPVMRRAGMSSVRGGLPGGRRPDRGRSGVRPPAAQPEPARERGAGLRPGPRPGRPPVGRRRARQGRTPPRVRHALPHLRADAGAEHHPGPHHVRTVAEPRPVPPGRRAARPGAGGAGGAVRGQRPPLHPRTHGGGHPAAQFAAPRPDGRHGAGGGLVLSTGRRHRRGRRRLVRRDPAVRRDLCETAVRQLVPVPQPDDIALLLARTHTLDPGHVVSWEVPLDPAAVGELRDLATRQVTSWGLTDLAMTTELIVSELVTNAIRYATPPIRLRLLRDARLTCEVADASSTAPRLRHARSTDEGGRGLFLVARLAHRWGARYTSEGKIIWAEQEIR